MRSESLSKAWRKPPAGSLSQGTQRAVRIRCRLVEMAKATTVRRTVITATTVTATMGRGTTVATAKEMAIARVTMATGMENTTIPGRETNTGYTSMSHRRSGLSLRT